MGQVWMAGLLVASLAAASAGSAHAADEAPLCPVADADGFREKLALLERDILLTRYAEAVEGLRRLQQDVVCMQSPASTQLLARLFTDLGYAQHRLGLTIDGDRSFAVAAGIDPGFTWDERFAASFGLRFYEAAQRARAGERIPVETTSVDPDIRWFVDGRERSGGRNGLEVYPGAHLVQVTRGGAWHGGWYDLQSGVILDLSALADRLPDAPPAVVEDTDAGLSVTERRERTRQGLRAGGTVAVVGGAGLLGVSLAARAQANALYDSIVADVTSYEDLVVADQRYETDYLPAYRRSAALSVAGLALVGAGVLVGAGSFLVPHGEGGVALDLAEGRALVLGGAPGGLSLGIRF